MPSPINTTRTFGPLHFEDLDPRRFEDLVRQLVYDFRPWRSLEATGRAGSDSGFDARGFEIAIPDDPSPSLSDEGEEEIPEAVQDRLWLIQCKREQDVTPSRMERHLADIPSTSTNNLYGAIFVASCDFSKKTRDVFRNWCRDKGIEEAHIWGRAELEDQLFLPKNDGLLFAYFGFSLRIRRRTIKTELRSRLTMKRKAERILQAGHGMILLRDPTDDRYPFFEPGNSEGSRRWRVARFIEHHPLGIMLETKSHYAYIGDDREQWDYIEEHVKNPVQKHDDPWSHSPTENRTIEELQQNDRIWRFWFNLPDRNRANYVFFEIIRYEEIMDIDEKGDPAARIPHIYVENITPGREGSYIENLARYDAVKKIPDTDRRIKFFPAEFPATHAEAHLLVDDPDEGDAG